MIVLVVTWVLLHPAVLCVLVWRQMLDAFMWLWREASETEVVGFDNHGPTDRR